jgi:SAM-dependent methyltransferase
MGSTSDMELILKMQYNEKYCPLCEGKNIENVFTLIRFQAASTLGYCHRCGLVYTLPKQDQSYKNYYYSKYREDKKKDKLAKRIQAADKEKIKRSKALAHYELVTKKLAQIKDLQGETEVLSVLDVGCSEGWLLDVFKKNGWRTYACEPDRESCARVAQKGHRAQQSYFSAELFPDQQFNLICLVNVLEHVPDLKVFITDLKECLAQDGLLYMILPSLEALGSMQKASPLFSRGHLNFFSKQALVGGLAGLGLETLQHFDGADLNDIYQQDPGIYQAVICKPGAEQSYDSGRASRVDYQAVKKIFRKYYAGLSFRNKLWVKLPAAYEFKNKIQKYVGRG